MEVLVLSKFWNNFKWVQISVGATWTFDKFKAAFAEAGDLAAIAEPNLKVSDNFMYVWLDWLRFAIHQNSGV